VSLAHVCYTQEEKDAYNLYRKSGTNGSSSQPVSRSTGLPDTGKKMLAWILVKAPDLLDEYIIDMCPVYQAKLNELIECGVDQDMAKDLAMKMAKKALQIPSEPAQAQAQAE
jgi:cell wall assembly regulator SMI1